MGRETNATAPLEKQAARKRKFDFFAIFFCDFVTCLEDSYMPSVTCDQYEKIRKFLGL
jgi:hypothetical protein